MTKSQSSQASQSPSSSIRLRLGELVGDVFSAQTEAETEAAWPHPDYAAAAAACRGDAEALAKLTQLCEDLESVIAPGRGPGSMLRISRAPAQAFDAIIGCCWREVLLDKTLIVAAWIALRQFSRALKAKEMDDGSRRMGVLIHAVAVRRLEAAGEAETDREKRKLHEAERGYLLKQKYLPKFIAEVLK